MPPLTEGNRQRTILSGQRLNKRTPRVAKVPSEDYHRIVAALRRPGFVQVRQRGSHLRMEKSRPDRTLKITVPAHRPVKRSTLQRILRDAEVTIEEFLEAL